MWVQKVPPLLIFLWTNGSQSEALCTHVSTAHNHAHWILLTLDFASHLSPYTCQYTSSKNMKRDTIRQPLEPKASHLVTSRWVTDESPDSSSRRLPDQSLMSPNPKIIENFLDIYHNYLFIRIGIWIILPTTDIFEFGIMGELL